MLDRVGLRPEAFDRYPHMFSGGQRQRVAIARALMLRPAVVTADEPVSALDVSIQAQVLNLMRDLQDELGIAYLFISHDISVVRHMARDVLVMYCGRPAEQGSRAAVLDRPLHPYTRMLLASTPFVDPAGAGDGAGAGRAAVAGQPAVRLRLRQPLPVRGRPLPVRTAAATPGRGACGRLPPGGTGRGHPGALRRAWASIANLVGRNRRATVEQPMVPHCCTGTNATDDTGTTRATTFSGYSTLRGNIRHAELEWITIS